MHQSLSAYNSRCLFWAYLFNSLNFLQPVLTLFYLSHGLHPRDLFVIMFCWSAAVLIGEIPTGVFADKFGPKLSFLTGAAVQMASIGVLFFADRPWQFFLYSFLNGFSVTFFSGADEAFLYESLREDGKTQMMDQVMGRLQSADFAASLVAVILGAWIGKDVTQAQFRLLILLTLCFQLLQFIFLVLLRTPRAHTRVVQNHPFRQVRDGWQVIRKKPRLLIMFLNVTLVFIPVGAVFKNFDQPFLKAAGVPVSIIGILYASAALLGFFVSRSIGWLTRRFPRLLLMQVTGLLSVAGLVLAALSHAPIWMAVGTFILLRLTQVVRYPIYSQISNDYIPSAVRATTISLLSIIDSCCDLMVFLVLSFFAGGQSLPVIFIAAACIALIGTLLPIRSLNDESVKSDQSL